MINVIFLLVRVLLLILKRFEKLSLTLISLVRLIELIENNLTIQVISDGWNWVSLWLLNLQLLDDFYLSPVIDGRNGPVHMNTPVEDGRWTPLHLRQHHRLHLWLVEHWRLLVVQTGHYCGFQRRLLDNCRLRELGHMLLGKRLVYYYYLRNLGLVFKEI